MAENKFIKHLKGEQTAGSLLEIKNQNTPASFGNMPQGTSDSNVKYSDVRGDVTIVANGTTAWKLNDSALTLAPIVNGDGTDYTGKYEVSGAGLWVNSTYIFPSTGDPNHPVAMIFNPNTKWVLKLCGDNLIVDNGETLELNVIITIGTSNIISKQFTIREQATQFCKELVIDFDESNSALIKASGLSTMQLQVLCGTADASARIYNGMTTLTLLQRKVDASVVSGSFANVEEVLRDGILPSDYFNNAAYIAQIEDGDSAYAVFTRDGDNVALSGWAQPIPDQTNNAGKFLTTDGSLMSWAQLTISDVDGLSTELSDLQDQIDDLSGRGRFLSVWNCTTGLAETNPPTSPYTYQSGDYFIVGTVGATNYKPDGSSYTTGVASTTVETAEVKVDDVYLYDGTNWKLLASSQRTYTFAGIAGSPYDNTNLGNALDSKVNKNADIVGNTKCKITYDNKGLVTAGADLAESDIPSLHLSKISDVTASASEVNVLDGITASTSELNVLDGITATTTELNYTDGVTSNIQTQLDAKQANLTAGTGIDITGAIISNSGVRSVSSGTANGTISVNTNGTSADVSVTGLGSAAYTSSSDYATSAQGGKADTAVQPNDNVSVLVNDAKYISNTATGTDSLTILGTAASSTNSVNIGTGAGASGIKAVSVGDYASAEGEGSIAIGGDSSTTYRARATHKGNIALGHDAYAINDTGIISIGESAHAQSKNAIQLGTGNNSTVNTFQVRSYTLLDTSTGLIPDARISTNITRTADLATVATTGDYTDLLNKPTIPAAQVNSDWNANSGVAQILNKPTLGTMAAESASDYTPTANLAAVATSGLYSDLSGTPTIPTTLAALTGDVSISSPSNGEHLVYNGTSQKWENTASAATVSWGGITGTLSNQTDLQNALNGKVSTGHEVIDFQAPNAGNNYTWYRKYADGWVEQGGIAVGNPVTITLPIVMADANYTAVSSPNGEVSNNWVAFGQYNYSTTGFQIKYNGDSSSATSICWQVSGMAA